MLNTILGDSRTLEKRSESLKLTARQLADSMKNGNFKSLYKGQGVDFSGVRDYLCGDDIRSIDWNVTARMEKPYVKVFEEEHELQIFLIIDDSLSMDTGTVHQSRLCAAHEAGALITLASALNDSPVGAVFFDGEIKFSIVPKNSRDHTLLLLSQLNKIPEKRVNGSALAHAVKGAGKILRKRSLVMIFSDFRTSDWETDFARLCLSNDVVAVCITDPSDYELPNCGAVSFHDEESGLHQLFPTSAFHFQASWREAARERIKNWKKVCIKKGAVPFVLSTEDDIAASLSHFFLTRHHI